jgi:chromosomal replication initiator protein
MRARLNERLNDSLGAGKYRLWFANTQLDCDCHHNRVLVTAPSRFVADWIGHHFRTDLKRIAEQELGAAVEVRIDAPEPQGRAGGRPGNDQTENDQPETATRSPTPRSIRTGPGSPDAPLASPSPSPSPSPSQVKAARLRHVLDDYVVGPSNELAYTAAVRLAGDSHQFNPLFVHGGCGVGKTHLLQGLCRRFADMHPAKRWRFTTAEQFTNEYIAAVRNNALPAFRAQVRRLDLLVVDDVHFLSNKNATQAEFLHTFDSIDLQGAKLAMASDSHPKQIRQFSEALVSRFVSGMVVEIDQPDPTTRQRLVHAIARQQQLNLHETVVPVIAERSQGSVREIEGMLNTLKALAALEGSGQAEGSVIGHVLVDRLLGASGTVRPARPIRMATIIDTVCSELVIDKSNVLSPDRHRQVVLGRGLIVHLARDLTTLSYPEIARQLARPNHSTVVTAHQRIKRQLKDGTLVRLAARPGTVSLPHLADQLRQRILRNAGGR